MLLPFRTWKERVKNIIFILSILYGKCRWHTYLHNFTLKNLKCFVQKSFVLFSPDMKNIFTSITHRIKIMDCAMLPPPCIFLIDSFNPFALSLFKLKGYFSWSWRILTSCIYIILNYEVMMTSSWLEVNWYLSMSLIFWIVWYFDPEPKKKNIFYFCSSLIHEPLVQFKWNFVGRKFAD